MLYRVKDRNTGLYLVSNGVDYIFNHIGQLYPSESYVMAVLRTLDLPYTDHYDFELIGCQVNEVTWKRIQRGAL